MPPEANSIPVGKSFNTLSAKVAIAKYGVTAQNQNPEMKSAERQYCYGLAECMWTLAA